MTDDNNFKNAQAADNASADSITYDKDWKTVTFTEYPSSYSESGGQDSENSDMQNKTEKNKNSPKQLVITVQLVLCIIIALAALILSAVGGDVYNTVREWYYDNLNKSAIFEGGSTPDISLLFGATNDEV